MSDIRTNVKMDEIKRKFAIVEFKEAGKCHVIPSKWIRKNNHECYFPSNVTNEKTFNRLVAENVSPKQDWKIASILKILGYSSVFERAYQKLQNVIMYNISDINTDREEYQKSQRKVRAKKVIVYSSDDDDDCSQTVFMKGSPIKESKKKTKALKKSFKSKCLKYPTPPEEFESTSTSNIQGTIVHKNECLSPEESAAITSKKEISPILLNLNQHMQPVTIIQYNDNNQNEVLSSIKPMSAHLNDGTPHQLLQKKDFQSSTQKSFSDFSATTGLKKLTSDNQQEILSPLTHNISLLSSPDLFSNEEDFESTPKRHRTRRAMQNIIESPPATSNIDYSITNDIKKIKANIDRMFKLMIEIKLLVQNGTQNNKNNVDESLLSDFNKQFKLLFPLKTFGKTEEVETLLKNDELFKTNMIKRIKSFIGMDQNHFISNSLNNLFDNNLAVHMSYSGKKRKSTDEDKIALKNLKLYGLICDISREKFDNYNEGFALKTSLSWLRHAVDRLKRSEKQAENP